MSPLLLLAGSVLLNAVAQIALRHSSTEEDVDNRRLWLGVWAATFVAATVLWIGALRNTEISWAYPMLGAGYVLVTLLARLLLGECISPFRWAAILVISAGVVMVGANR